MGTTDLCNYLGPPLGDATSVWLPVCISWGDPTHTSLEALIILIVTNSVSCLFQSADIHYQISIYLFVRSYSSAY